MTVPNDTTSSVCASSNTHGEQDPAGVGVLYERWRTLREKAQRLFAEQAASVCWEDKSRMDDEIGDAIAEMGRLEVAAAFDAEPGAEAARMKLHMAVASYDDAEPESDLRWNLARSAFAALGPIAAQSPARAGADR